MYKEGYLERKGFFGKSRNWYQLKGSFFISEICTQNIQGHILRYYSEPHGKLKGKFNLYAANIVEKTNPSSLEIEVRLKSGTTIFLFASSSKDKENWSQQFIKAKSRAIEETNRLIEMYKQEGTCAECIAVLAAEQNENEAEKDSGAEEEGNEDGNTTKESKSGSLMKSSSLMGNSSSFMMMNSANGGALTASALVSELLGMSVTDLEGKKLLFGKIFEREVMVVALLRHFG